MQFKSLRSAETLGPPPPLCKDLGGGYTPLLGKNYSPPKNLLISAKIEKWAIFGMAAHLWYVWYNINFISVFRNENMVQLWCKCSKRNFKERDDAHQFSLILTQFAILKCISRSQIAQCTANLLCCFQGLSKNHFNLVYGTINTQIFS